MWELRDTWRVCHCGVEQGVKAVILLKREPEGRDTREVRPWPEAWEVYSSRSWRLLASTGKAGVEWSEVVFVDVVEDAIFRDVILFGLDGYC